MKKQAEEHKQNHPTEEFEEDEDGEYEGFDSEGYDDSDEFDEEEETKKDGNDSEASPEKESDEKEESDSGNEAGGTQVSEDEAPDTKSYTDEAYRKNESKLFATDGRTHYYANIPNVKLEDAIVGHKALWKRFREDASHTSKHYRSNDFTGLDIPKFMKLRNDSKKVVGYLAKEFELRKNADQLNLVGMAKAVNDLGNRAKAGKLKPDDTQGGTYTVTNVGTFGSVFGTPIINQPQVGILALGAIRKVPAVIETPEGDFIGIRQKMFLSHSYDHRVVDGALGGSFVKRVAEYLEAFDVNREY